jgi:hypothetical protein
MQDNSEKLAKSVRGLVLSVWALVFVTAATTLWSVVTVYLFAPSASNTTGQFPSMNSTASIATIESSRFHELPIEDKLKKSSAIVVARHEKRDQKLIVRVSEILCQRDGVRLGYKVGDMMRDSGRAIEGDTDYGDGQVVFFSGKEADFRFSTTFRNDRLYTGGQMSLADFRALIAQHCKP